MKTERLTVKDLAMYIGCDAVDSEYPEEGYFELNLATLISYLDPDIEELPKPILRPLSNMTKEEEKEFESFVMNNESEGMVENIKDMAILTMMLISKQFDVFDWIGNGLAIDKTKL